ncbi:endonuclease domain-containing protein [Phenylobacterium sp.]|uniref:endonuclease domain-containing protein n=1 Tax=Phenylobacterium sp. TaxID=1871053 RepID=UPI002720C9A0|nr:DUF559 domain-containing protein [Phenylobacterium sp.]MDO8381061.1 DUF559 domain-containing protein [Phenylobacterium sp.]
MEAPARTRRFAKELRRTMSLPEVLLWVQIKGRKLDGLQFRKQHPIGPYILDFYCERAKLCIEIDGASHGTEDRPERDARRDSWLAEQGVRTLRLRAGYVLEEMDGVLSMVRQAAKGELLDP